MASVTVPLRGDRAYKDAFAAVARQRRVTMAELVRRALDHVYGDDIATVAVFFANDGQSVIHSDNAQADEVKRND